jgi:hypothetical protein
MTLPLLSPQLHEAEIALHLTAAIEQVTQAQQLAAESHPQWVPQLETAIGFLEYAKKYLGDARADRE